MAPLQESPGQNFGFLRPCGLTARLEVEIVVSASCKLNPWFEFELNAFNSCFVWFVNEVSQPPFH